MAKVRYSNDFTYKLFVYGDAIHNVKKFHSAISASKLGIHSLVS